MDYHGDYDDISEELGEFDGESDHFSDGESDEDILRFYGQMMGCRPFSILRHSMLNLYTVCRQSSIFQVKQLGEVLLLGPPTRYQGPLWILGNPIYTSLDDSFLASKRRGIIGEGWAAKLRNVHKEAEYYLRRPQDMLHPFDNSIRALFFDFQYYHLEDFEDDYGDFLDTLPEYKPRKKSRKAAHKRRHQKRGGKGKNKKAKTASLLQDDTQPGNFEEYEDSESDEAMDCDPV